MKKCFVKDLPRGPEEEPMEIKQQTTNKQHACELLHKLHTYGYSLITI
jgi:hypothetical protein